MSTRRKFPKLQNRPGQLRQAKTRVWTVLARNTDDGREERFATLALTADDARANVQPHLGDGWVVAAVT